MIYQFLCKGTNSVPLIYVTAQIFRGVQDGVIVCGTRSFSN